VSQIDPDALSDMQDFQDRGEPWRAALGIDGTAGDAQDIQHEFIPDSPGGPCVVCGLAQSYRRHAHG
jgi:hypothetical protein